MYLKRRQNAFNLTSNVAYYYAGQCKHEDITINQNVAYEPTTVLLSPNVAYGCHGLEAQQNVAYKPTKVVLSPNVAYESHMHDHVHQGAESQDEHEYNYIII